MDLKQVTERISNHLEESIVKDKEIFYKLLVKENKREIEKSVRDAVNQSISHVLGDLLKGWVQVTLKEKVTNNLFNYGLSSIRKELDLSIKEEIQEEMNSFFKEIHEEQHAIYKGEKMITWLKVTEIYPPEDCEIFLAYKDKDCDPEEYTDKFEYLNICVGFFCEMKYEEEHFYFKMKTPSGTEYITLELDEVEFWAPMPNFLRPKKDNIANLS